MKIEAMALLLKCACVCTNAPRLVPFVHNYNTTTHSVSNIILLF